MEIWFRLLVSKTPVPADRNGPGASLPFANGHVERKRWRLTDSSSAIARTEPGETAT
jgi:hypothetical protein